jgi:hypothetical protein
LLIFPLFDLIECVESAFVNAGAFLGCGVPVVDAVQVVRPERPGTALHRSEIVYRTAFCVTISAKENTILCSLVFFYGNAQANAAQIFCMKVLRSHIKMLRKFFNFLLRYPYNAFFGARAAITALLAFEVKTVLVPFVFRHNSNRE